MVEEADRLVPGTALVVPTPVPTTMVVEGEVITGVAILVRILEGVGISIVKIPPVVVRDMEDVVGHTSPVLPQQPTVAGATLIQHLSEVEEVVLAVEEVEAEVTALDTVVVAIWHV